jgi:O-antigen ligase
MRFRGDAHAPRRLHPLEKALLVVTGLHLCFIAWAIGGMTRSPWPQFVSLGLAALGFLLSLINRHYTAEYAREGEFKLVMWPKLVRFPIFWLGLALMIYMAVQGFNPAWRYMTTYTVPLQLTSWWLTPIEYIPWLPSGIDAPITPYVETHIWEIMNTWRMMIIYAAPWLTVCSLWVGVTRRVTLVGLLGVIAVNGGLLALVGVLEKVTDARKILWLVAARNNYFTASFPYKNHAGAYFNLVLAVAAALAFWHFTRTDRRSGRANPAPLHALCAVLAGLVVLLSLARVATILMVVFLAIMLVAGGIWLARAGADHGSRAAAGLLGLLLAVFIGGGVLFLDKGRAMDKIELLAGSERKLSIEDRLDAQRATWDMIQDKWLTGRGAGGFRYYFPVYQQHYPSIYNLPDGRRRENSRWEYAHNDYLQILAELGAVGGAIFVAGFGYWMLTLFRHGAHRRPHLLILILGLLLLMANAWTDLPLYCPAVLILWCVLWALTARWAEFEDNRVHD